MHPDVAAAAGLLTGLSDPATVDGELYAWFLAMTPLPEPGEPGPADRNLAGALAAAHADAGRFVGGWRVEAATVLGGVVARHGPWRRHLPRAGYTVPARPGLPGRPGDALLATAAWTWADPEHGFWYTRRGTWPPPGADRLVRTYLNIAPDDAPRAVGVLTACLARRGRVPYQLKTPLYPRHGGRADALVLYLGAPDAADCDDDLRAAVTGLADVLRPARPRFTVPLVPGAAQGEGSLDGDSFGQTRCRVLAAVWRSLEPDRRRDLPAVTAAVLAGLTAAGIDPDAPHRLPRPVPAGASS
jgi:hypothetical protein